MKLLEVFKKQLAEFDQLERVWLTGLTVDIAFVETYILPAILGEEPPRLRMDYEALQLALNEKNLDIRVFCDKHYIGEDANKRTLLPVQGISTGRDGGIWPEGGITKESLFHAKVIYLEGKKGKDKHRILGAGSANLTLSGWGRNREVFSFVPVDELSLYESVSVFFTQLFQNIGETCPLKARPTFPRVNRRARFCHSFQEESFIYQLVGGGSAREMAIWSPYLSKDLSIFMSALKDHLGQDELTIHLVPDRMEGQHIRSSWSKDVEGLLTTGELMIYQLPKQVNKDDRQDMTHAKLWKTPTCLAIGSWNCTRRGANIYHDEKGDWLPGNNIEAGLLFNDTSSVTDFVGERIEEGLEALFASEEQLKQEALRVPELPPFDLDVSFCWSSLNYEVTGIWNDGEVASEAYSLRLPDVKDPIPLRWLGRELKHPISERVSSPRQLLTDHSYQIYCGGELCFTGLLLSKNQRFRRAQRYETLENLLDAYVQTGPEPALDDVAYRVTDDEEGELLVDGLIEKEAAQTQIGTVSSGISYFRLFLASYHYAAQLRAAMTNSSAKYPLKELEKWVFIRPGSLEEWVHKSAERMEQRTPGVFEWFLAREVQGLCDLARDLKNSFDGTLAQVPDERWEALKLPLPNSPHGASQAYVKYLENQYQKMHKHWGEG